MTDVAPADLHFAEGAADGAADGAAEPSHARGIGRPRFGSTDELRTLVAAFESTALPCEEWTHGAHLAVALWYLVWYGRDMALARMRDGLRRYNAAHAHHPMRVGYHETLTRFWLWVVRRHLRHTPMDGSLAEIANDLVVACTDRALPFAYYSRDYLMSTDARHRWVEPNLRPLEDPPV